jgi:hypothetical protein
MGPQAYKVQLDQLVLQDCKEIRETLDQLVLQDCKEVREIKEK